MSSICREQLVEPFGKFPIVFLKAHVLPGPELTVSLKGFALTLSTSCSSSCYQDVNGVRRMTETSCSPRAKTGLTQAGGGSVQRSLGGGNLVSSSITQEVGTEGCVGSQLIVLKSPSVSSTEDPNSSYLRAEMWKELNKSFSQPLGEAAAFGSRRSQDTQLQNPEWGQ